MNTQYACSRLPQCRAPGLVVTLACVLLLSGCAMQPWYDSPPPMPVAVSPVAGDLFDADSVIEFSWLPTPQTEYYDFHVFNAENNDIDRYMKSNLKPADICQDDLCRLQVAIRLPESQRHAWRVRSVNVAGRSSWTRIVFGMKGQ